MRKEYGRDKEVKKPFTGHHDPSEKPAPRERRKPSAKFHLAKGTVIDYKEIALLQKYVSDRGKILSRRFTGMTAKNQRELTRAIKKARFLGLLHALGSKLPR